MSSDEWWKGVLNTDANLAQSIVKNLLWDHGVKLLALDFDLTIVNINTAGRWRESPEKLAKHVRPCFRELIGAALQNGSMKVSVVTYSVQPELIAQMFKVLFPKNNTDNIVIEGNEKHIHPQISPEAYRFGKQKHIEKVTKRLYDRYGIAIHPHQVILFDDRSRYIKIARENGHLAFEVNDNVTLDDIRQFVDSLSKPSSPSDPVIHPQSTSSKIISVLSVGSWPPRPVTGATDAWTGPFNVYNLNGEQKEEEEDDDDKSNKKEKSDKKNKNDKKNKSDAKKDKRNKSSVVEVETGEEVRKKNVIGGTSVVNIRYE